MKKVELLAPAGSFDAMRAAINAGADAVYMGGSKFGARAYAENPDEDGMIKAIEFCHLRGRRLYMTVNTLFKENELFDGLYDFLLPYYRAGLDAVIVQDTGAVRFISENFPGLDIHLSTQCTITMPEGAENICNGLQKCQEKAASSITRLVPARELSLEELENMRKKTKLEIEVFIHGALCYCYSGQCLLSSMAGGRSGNRGRCAQPCRRLYSVLTDEGAQDDFGLKGYYLSPKDMCALPYIHKMIEAGIDSFKIEGRMKSPEYVAGVVSVYRYFIDRYYELGTAGYEDWLSKHPSELENAVDKLRELYNRGGFNNGYLYQHNGRDMMSLSRPNHSGIKVGEVVKCEGRKAYIRLSEAVGKGDVLEIRSRKALTEGSRYDKAGISVNQEKAIYEFTSGEPYNSGVQFSILTMKDRQATPGLEVFRTKNAALLDGLDKKYLEKDVLIPVRMKYSAGLGRETLLSIIAESGESFSVSGNIPDEAKNAPTTREGVIKQLKKLGDTEFEAGDIDVEIDGNLFIPVGELNRLRREAVDGLRNAMLEKSRGSIENKAFPETEDSFRDNEQESSGVIRQNVITALASDLVQLKEILKHGFIDTVYFDISNYKYGTDYSFSDEILRLCNSAEKKLMFALPPILRSSGAAQVSDFIGHYLGKTGFLIRNREELELYGRIVGKSQTDASGYPVRADYNIYAMNTFSSASSGYPYTASPEMNVSELDSVSGEKAQLIIYGLMPVMYSAQCVHKNVFGKCTDGKRVTLRDEKGYAFPTAQLCGDCYNIIYNSSVLNLIHRFDEVERLGFGSLRLNFTFETESETKLVLDCLQNVMEGRNYLMPDEIMGMKFTNGHFNRGVE